MDDADDDEQAADLCSGARAAAAADHPDVVMQMGVTEEGLGEVGAAVSSSQQPVAAELGHQWQWNGNSWQCADCLRCTRNRRKCTAACSGMPGSISRAVAAAESNGHQLVGACDSTGLYCIWCKKCGAYGSNRTVRLTSRCKQPSRQGQTVLNRVANLRHPEGVRKLQAAGRRLRVKPHGR